MRRSRGKVAKFRSIGIAERTTCNLQKEKARRAVPPWSILREIWLMMLRPRDPDILETNMPTATETDLNNRLLQTTCSKLLAIMREKREKQAANREAPNKSRRHLPSVPKPCGIGYQTRPPLMKRFKALISGLLGYIKGGGIAPNTWQRSAPVPLDKGTTKPGPARFRLYTCCVRLARLSMGASGETVRTRVHAKSTPTHTAKVGDERLPFSSNTW